jgi:hypothetical protein
MDRFDLHHPDRFRNLKQRGTGFALAPRLLDLTSEGDHSLAEVCRLEQFPIGKPRAHMFP